SGFGDDAMVLDPSSTQLHVIAHGEMSLETVQPSTHLTMSLDPANPVIAALPLRVNIDGRPGLVVLKENQSAPEIMMPLPDPTFTVNRTDDPTPPAAIANACNGAANDCSLREAILRANATAGTDTIMVPTGTYTLSLPRTNGVYDGKQGTLEIQDSV